MTLIEFYKTLATVIGIDQDKVEFKEVNDQICRKIFPSVSYAPIDISKAKDQL